MSIDSTRALPMEAALDALALMHQYALHFPELKLPHITLMRCTYPLPLVRLELQIDIDHFEPWREALELGIDTVTLYRVGMSSSNLEAAGTVCMGIEGRVVEVPVHLYSPGLMPLEQHNPAGITR